MPTWRPARSCRGCLVAGTAAVALVLVLFLARPLWLPLPARFLVVEDPLQPAEAIVPLGGGAQRAVYAAQLFRGGYAGWYLATNMPLDVPGVRDTYGELVRKEAMLQGVPGDRILITPGEVRTTCQEAAAVREVVDAQGWRSLLVVTDPLHTRRSRLCFDGAFRDSDVAVSVRAIEGSWYDPGAWWQSIDGLRETWTEYTKLALHFLGYR